MTVSCVSGMAFAENGTAYSNLFIDAEHVESSVEAKDNSQNLKSIVDGDLSSGWQTAIELKKGEDRKVDVSVWKDSAITFNTVYIVVNGRCPDLNENDFKMWSLTAGEADTIQPSENNLISVASVKKQYNIANNMYGDNATYYQIKFASITACGVKIEFTNNRLNCNGDYGITTKINEIEAYNEASEASAQNVKFSYMRQDGSADLAILAGISENEAAQCSKIIFETVVYCQMNKVADTGDDVKTSLYKTAITVEEQNVYQTVRLGDEEQYTAESFGKTGYVVGIQITDIPTISRNGSNEAAEKHPVLVYVKVYGIDKDTSERVDFAGTNAYLIEIPVEIPDAAN